MGHDEARAVRLVRLTGGAVLALGIALFAIMPQTAVRRNVDGLRSAVIGFELATTPAHVLDILGHPGDVQRPEMVRAMDRTNRVDFLFMLAYPALSFAIALWLAALGIAPRWLVPAVGALAIAMWAGDLIENLQLLRLSQTTDPGAMTTPLAILSVATRIKWGALFITALLEGKIAQRAPRGWTARATIFIFAGALGIYGLVAWLPGVEHGANLLGLGWAWTWVRALRARPARHAALATAD